MLRFYFASTDGKTLLCLLVTQIKFHACRGHWFGRVNDSLFFGASIIFLIRWQYFTKSKRYNYSEICFCQEVTFQGHLA